MRQIAVQAESGVSGEFKKFDGCKNLPDQQHPAAVSIGRPSCFVNEESEN